MDWKRALPVFSVVFPLIYLAAMYWNLPVFTYVPKTGEFHAWLFQPPRETAPGMFYYGWLLTAGIGAAVVAAGSAALPGKASPRRAVTLAWIAPVLVIVALLYILRDWFTH